MDEISQQALSCLVGDKKEKKRKTCNLVFLLCPAGYILVIINKKKLAIGLKKIISSGKIEAKVQSGHFRFNCFPWREKL